MSFEPGQPLAIGDVRLALFATLWARSEGGDVAMSNENAAALDDLEWLGIEPDTMIGQTSADRASEVADELIEAGRAYPCFCTAAELREMPVDLTGGPESVIYDGRCRRLSESDRKALRKAGRKPAVRLVAPEEPAGFTDAAGVEHTGSRLPDFKVIETGGAPTPAFRAVVGFHDGEADRTVVSSDGLDNTVLWSVIAQSLEWELPQVAVVPPLTVPDEPGFIGVLRASGYMPRAVLLYVATSGWDPGDAVEVDDMVEGFTLASISPEPPEWSLERLRDANAAVIAAMPETERTAAIIDHLERRGFPLSERDDDWQLRFVESVSKDMVTLADAEPLAALLITTTVDYDRDVARILREPATHELIDQFQESFTGIDDADEEAWRNVLQEFRRQSSAPGRALATLRMVLTGQRAGPNLTAVLALLGSEGCSARLEKARRYTA